MVIYITRKEMEVSQGYKNLFPANFFLPSADENGNILTCGNRYMRYTCNEYHPLSQFIINNGCKLNERVPGIFNEMLRILSEEGILLDEVTEEDCKEQVIEKMNKLLENLRKLPGGLFNITDNLFLSDKDFY
jgi:EAL domain-containing protein (putative c-di-GMP-specific phosphodiesterase class I)